MKRQQKILKLKVVRHINWAISRAPILHERQPSSAEQEQDLFFSGLYYLDPAALKMATISAAETYGVSENENYWTTQPNSPVNMPYDYVTCSSESFCVHSL